MKLEINIDEAKIQELANNTPLDDLPRHIYYEAKKQAIEMAVKEIKDKLVDKPYYSSSKETLYSEVKDAVHKQLQEAINNLIQQKFNERELKAAVERHAEAVITSWIEDKVITRLNEIKADIFFGSKREWEANAQAEYESRQE